MVSCPFPYPTTIHRHQHSHAPPPMYNCATVTTNSMAFGFSSSSKVNLRRSFPFKRKSWLGRCHATSPQSESPSKKQPPPSSRVMATFRRFQDTLQIFFAVLFWMSLFFWSSAWDGGNGGKPNKGSRFRK